MKPTTEHPELLATIRVARTLQVLLMVGLAAFSAFAWWTFDQKGGVATEGILTWVLLALVGLNVPVFFVLRSVLLRRARDDYSRRDPARFAARYQAGCLVQAAILEGVGLFGAVTYMLEGTLLALGIAGTMVGLLGLLLPSEGAVNALLEDAP
ncbi:MAG: hypothetical protein O2894_08385 [Planctomycetota bacterium]|nr:hypothetical protein [Planctomycetota bacterium]